MNPQKTLSQVILLGAMTAPAFAAGFQLQERSTTGLGRAFSGEAAIADDASVLASNPAGIILLDDTSISVGLSYIRPNGRARGTFTPSPTGTPQTAESDNLGEDAIVPSIYLTHKVNDKLAVGFGTFTTYGLATDYDSGFAGTSLADESSLESVNANLAVAYRLNNQITLGAGLNALYAEGTINSSAGGNRLVELEGEDFGFGYNLGILYEHTERTRFGLHYRSKVRIKLDGETNVTLPSIPAGSFPTSLSVDLPDTVEFSAYHEVCSKWAVHGDIVWTRWSRYNGLSPQLSREPFPGFAQALDNSATTDWDNAFRYSVGATYKHSEKLTIRFGAAFDESPINGNRELRIPDEDRIWLSAGFSYAISENYNFDFGYTHIFLDDPSIEQTSSLSGSSFVGKASGDVDIISVGISGTF